VWSLSLLLVFEVIQQDFQGIGILSEVLNNNHGATNHLSRLSLLVDLAQSCPLSKLLGFWDSVELDVMLSAKSFNKLHVRSLSAVGGKNAQMSLAAIKSLCAFVETSSETVVYESVLQNLLESTKNIEDFTTSWSDFNFLNRSVGSSEKRGKEKIGRLK